MQFFPPWNDWLTVGEKQPRRWRSMPGWLAFLFWWSFKRYASHWDGATRALLLAWGFVCAHFDCYILYMMSKNKIWIIFFLPPNVATHEWRTMRRPCGQQQPALTWFTKGQWNVHVTTVVFFFHICLSFMDQGFEINAFQAATCYNQHNKFWLQRISPLVATRSKANSIKKKNSHTAHCNFFIIVPQSMTHYPQSRENDVLFSR